MFKRFHFCNIDKKTNKLQHWCAFSSFRRATWSCWCCSVLSSASLPVISVVSFSFFNPQKICSLEFKSWCVVAKVEFIHAVQTLISFNTKFDICTCRNVGENSWKSCDVTVLLESICFVYKEDSDWVSMMNSFWFSLFVRVCVWIVNNNIWGGSRYL